MRNLGALPATKHPYSCDRGALGSESDDFIGSAGISFRIITEAVNDVDEETLSPEGISSNGFASSGVSCFGTVQCGIINA